MPIDAPVVGLVAKDEAIPLVDMDPWQRGQRVVLAGALPAVNRGGVHGRGAAENVHPEVRVRTSVGLHPSKTFSPATHAPITTAAATPSERALSHHDVA